MPELPEVEVFRNYVVRTSLNRGIEKVTVKDKRMLSCSAAHLSRSLVKNKFTDAVRLGKYLLLASNKNRWLVLHFGLTGDLHYQSNDEDEPDFTRLNIYFNNDHYLAYTNVRRIGEIGLTASINDFKKERDLGIDALTISEKDFQKVLLKRKGNVKSVLMDQHVIAGIGNIYADEILFQTNIHPKERIENLTAIELRKLFRNMITVLKTVIRCGADLDKMPNKLLLRARGKDKPCPVCGTKIKQLKMGGRSSYYCPNCQPQ